MWFGLALLAGFLFAVNKLIFRFALTKGVNPIAFLATHEFVAGAILLPFAVTAFSLPQSTGTWLACLLFIPCIFLTDLFAALALSKTEASIYQIVNQLRHIVVLFGAYFLFTEVITLSKVISILLIMLGVGIAVLSRQKFKLTIGVVYAALSTLFISMSLLCVKVAVADVQPVVLASVGLLVSGLLCYGWLLFKEYPLSNVLRIKHRGQLLAAAIIFAVFEFTIFMALAIGEASKVTPVSQSSLIFTLIGGYIFLNERQYLREKIIGSIMIAAGIGLLYFA